MASQRHVRKLVRHYATLMGFAHPMKISVAFHDSRHEQYCDENDRDCYGYCQPQPQYHRCVVGFDLYHPKWHERDETVEECVRHELFHAFIAMYTQAATHLTSDKEERVRKILGDLEDSLVQKLASMPLWKYAPEA